MVGRIHIVVAERSAIIRCGIVSLLQREAMPNVTIAEVSDISNLYAHREIPSPDLLIVNPSQLGAVSPAQLRSEVGGESLKVIALQSAFVDQSTIQNYDDVISIYDSIDSIKGKIQNLTAESGDGGGRKRDLSQREREIIVCVVKGMTNKQIADKLILSTHTVIAHRRNIANKLQINSPSGLTIYAIVNKLVDLSDIKNSIMQSSVEES